MALMLVVISLLISMAFSSSITCPGALCNNTNITCTPGEACNVYCAADRACITYIYCPANYPCNVYCKARYSCLNTTIYAQTSSILFVYCQFDDVCIHPFIYCPTDGFQTGDTVSLNRNCIINTNTESVYTGNIYAPEGFFLDVDILTSSPTDAPSAISASPSVPPTPMPTAANITNLTCNRWFPCENQIINCPINHECHIQCTSSDVCANSEISCPQNKECHIQCIAPYACSGATIHAESSTKLVITAEGREVLRDANVYCPNDGLYSIDKPVPCVIRASSWPGVLTAYKIYAVEGFNDVSIDCIGGNYCVSGGALFCKLDYSDWCWINTASNGTCDESSESNLCNDYRLTSTPIIEPTLCPTMEPRYNPNYPTFEPTTAPSISPSTSPTDNPTPAPTSKPSNSPSISPVPTENPTHASTLSAAIPTNQPTNGPTSAIIVTKNIPMDTSQTQGNNDIMYKYIIICMGLVIAICCIGYGCLWAKTKHKIGHQHQRRMIRLRGSSHEPSPENDGIHMGYMIPAGNELQVCEKDRKCPNSDVRLNTVFLEPVDAEPDDEYPSKSEIQLAVVDPEPKVTNGQDDLRENSSSKLYNPEYNIPSHKTTATPETGEGSFSN